MARRNTGRNPFWTRLELWPTGDGRAHLYVFGVIGYCLYDVILDPDLDSPPMRMELEHLWETLDIPATRMRQVMRVFVQSGQDKKVVQGWAQGEKPTPVLPSG